MCLAIPGKVISIRDVNGTKMGKADFAGIVKEVCLECIPDVKLGQYVMVHVGFAISALDEEEAARTYRALEELQQLAELEIPQDEDFT